MIFLLLILPHKLLISIDLVLVRRAGFDSSSREYSITYDPPVCASQVHDMILRMDSLVYSYINQAFPYSIQTKNTLLINTLLIKEI